MTKPNETELAARGRQIDEEVWRLPEKYRLTPKMLAESDAQQAELAKAANLPFGQMSPQDAERARSVVIAENLRTNLEQVRKLIAAAILSGQGDLKELQAIAVAIRHQRAERLAIIGRYDLAAGEEPDVTYRDRYLKILEAVWRDDEEWCDCPDHRGSGAHAGITVSRQHVVEEIWSMKHAAIMPLLRCGGCGTLNVAPLPKHIRDQRLLRVRARQLVEKLNPTEAAVELTKHGHDKRLLK